MAADGIAGDGTWQQQGMMGENLGEGGSDGSGRCSDAGSVEKTMAVQDIITSASGNGGERHEAAGIEGY